MEMFYTLDGWGLVCLSGVMKKLLILLLFITGFSSSQTWGADYSKGFSAYESGDYATALKEWTPLAEQGDASAQYNLGLMYRNGRGVIQDYKTAVKWYTLAAEQGWANAQLQLGVSFILGEGVIEDTVYAHMWLNIARSNGSENDPHLIYSLGKHMTPSQFEKAQDLARECVKKNYKGC
jgi:TPR repeat protein